MSEWLRGWIRTGRLESPDALKNQDLWRQLATLSEKHEVSWEWVAGHAGHPFNERCDKLAKRASEQGVRAGITPEPPAEIHLEEKLIAVALAPVPLAPVPCEDVVFDADDDGQFRLC